MATAAKSMDDAVIVLSLSPNDVLIGDRLGAFHPDKAAALGKMMAEDGQIVPIIVRKSGPRVSAPWTLVAGHHRLEGARLEGLAVIDAIEMVGSLDDYLKAEAIENAARPERSPLERASFVRAIADAAEARLKDQHGDMSPEQIAARARWDSLNGKVAGVERVETLNDAEADNARLNLSHAYGWRDEVADAMGMSLASIKRDIALHRALIAPFPALWRDLATHPVVGSNASALQDIAAYAVDARRAIIETLLKDPEMALQQALDALLLKARKGAAATGATKFMNNMTTNLTRLSAGDQVQIAPAIVGAMKPSALLALRAALDARIEKEGISA